MTDNTAAMRDRHAVIEKSAAMPDRHAVIEKSAAMRDRQAVIENAPAIEVVGLSKWFGDQVVLDAIDLVVPRGECVALRGANGAGKTTLLRCLAALVRPTAGEVRWLGRPAAAAPADRRLVGMVAHETLVYPHLTVQENLLFAARMCDVADPARRTAELLSSAGLEVYARRPASQVSRGTRQRLAVLRAVVHDPPILLLDEPFSGLDARAADWLAGLLGELRGRGRTVCLVSHDPHRARELADRVIELCSGRLRELKDGASDETRGTPPAARAA